MKIDLSDTDVLFIYGHFQKQLAEIDKIATASGCPFDKKTIEAQKESYISVVEKLASQIPYLEKMNKCF